MEGDLRYFELNTGAKIPSLGIGTYRTPAHIIAAAIKIGVVLKELFGEGVVKREDLFITSKLWNADHEPEDVPKALHKTLNDLQLEYLDLYLIHWPVKEKKGVSSDNVERFLQADIPNTWKAMEALYHSGKVRAIGVSNFSAKTLDALLELSRIVPAVNQVECHPMWQQPKLRQYCKSKGIHLSAYSPLGSQSSEATKKGVLVNPILNKVAEELGKSPAQVALRWGLQQGHSVLPKTSNEERLNQNLHIFDWFIPQYLLSNFSQIVQEKFLKATQLGYEASSQYITLEELWDDQH